MMSLNAIYVTTVQGAISLIPLVVSPFFFLFFFLVFLPLRPFPSFEHRTTALSSL